MDERTERLGEHAAETSPRWAVTVLGPVPDHPVDRLDWQQRASKIGAYRELYGVENQDGPLEPEPPATAPEQRAAWYSAFAAITRTDAVDARSLPDQSLCHMRESALQERDRMGAASCRQAAPGCSHGRRGRTAASAPTPRLRLPGPRGDHEAVARQEHLARSASALERLYRTQEQELARTQENRTCGTS